MRCLHETDITRAKIEHLYVLGQALGPDGGVHVDITETEAHAWVAALNDIRLYVASGEVFGEDAEQDRESLVEWLAYNQESLLNAMMG